MTQDFLKAKNSKSVCSFTVKRLPDATEIMSLSVTVKIPYSEETRQVDISVPTTIEVENYSGWTHPTNKVDVSSLRFHMSVAQLEPCHVHNFLHSIKKDSTVSFRVVAFNTTDTLLKAEMTLHELYGYIDGKCYALNTFAGRQNLASPINCYL